MLGIPDELDQEACQELKALATDARRAHLEDRVTEEGTEVRERPV